MLKLKTIYDHIIIGSGIAGTRAAETIRTLNSDADILMISSEAGHPYKRTNIDKHIAEGFSETDFLLHPEEWYSENRIEYISEVSVDSIQIPDKKVILNGDKIISFGTLLLATGANPVIPDFIKTGSVPTYYIRTKTETLNFMRELNNAESVTIIGGGVQSAEIAEQCILKGKEVNLICRNSRLLRKYFPADYSSEIENLLMEKGVNLYLSIDAYNISWSAESGYKIGFGDKQLHSDMLVTSCGIEAEVRLAKTAGIKTDKGIVVDEHCETSVPGIFAAGDCAQYGSQNPAGLWHSAEYMGITAGNNMCGKKESIGSKTFRLKCELFGSFFFSQNYSAAGSLNSESFSGPSIQQRWFFKESAAAGVIMTNDKPRAKTYERAVNDGWNIYRIKQELPV